jgi:hypothetical protein
MKGRSSRLWIGMIVSCLAGVAIVFMVVPGGSRGATRDATWEEETLGVRFHELMERQPLAMFPKSRYAITCMLHVPDKRQVWVGTTDGVLLCSEDGKILREVAVRGLHGMTGTEERVVGPSELRVLFRNTIQGLVRLSDGTIWARGLSGAYHISATGDVLEDDETDKAVATNQYQLICREAAVQQWFPVLGGNVYLPWAGSGVAQYDGSSWSVVGQISPDSRGSHNYWSSRRVHVIGDKLCVAGREGLLDVQAGRPIIQSIHFAAARSIRPDATLCLEGGNVWMIDKAGSTKIGALPAEGVSAVAVAPDLFAVSDYDSSVIGILDHSSDKWSLRALQMPPNHRWRAFILPDQATQRPASRETNIGPRAFRLLVATSNGVIETDGKEAKAILELPRPQLEAPWDALISHGVHVNACLPLEEHWLIGTAIGLGHFTPRTGEFVWLWQVSGPK